jgi:hypothetical protein
MPYDSNGVFSLTPGYLAIAGQTIQPSQHNPPLEDIVAQGLSAVLVRDGRAPMIGNLKMNTFRITGLGDGTAPADAVTKGQMETAVTGATDSVAYNALKFSTKSATYTAVKADNATAFRFTAVATLNLTAAATLGANWWCEIQATNGNVVIDPNAAETIDGAATVVVQTGQIARVYCNGTSFATELSGDPLAGPQIQGFSSGLALSTNVADAANDVDIAAGAAASDAPPFYLMQLGAALTKRLDANWAVGTNQGGLDTGSVSAAATYYIWLIQRSDTLVTDVLFSLSSTAPTIPASYDRKRLIGSLVRTGGINGAPIPPVPESSDVRAWVNFNGTGTVAIRASKNVNSITDNGTGDYTVNFATPLPSGNYVVAGMGAPPVPGGGRGYIELNSPAAKTATSCRITTGSVTGAVGAGDLPEVDVIFIGG